MCPRLPWQNENRNQTNMAALTVQSSGILPEYSKEKLPVICNVITDKELDNSKVW